MGTKLYFRDAIRCAGPTSEQTSWTSDINAVGYDSPKVMSLAKGASQIESTLDLSSGKYGYHNVFVSSILAAQSLPTQTITLAIASRPNFNVSTYVVYNGWGVYLYRGGSNVATIVANRTKTIFLGWGKFTEEMGIVDTATSSLVTIQKGDRICVEIWSIVADYLPTYNPRIFYYNGTVEPQQQVEISSSASYLQFGTTTLQYIDDTRAGVAAY